MPFLSLLIRLDVLCARVRASGPIGSVARGLNARAHSAIQKIYPRYLEIS